MALRFQNEVVVITGAGRGLGRAHALLLSSLGASVVVNDLGTSMSGEGSDNGPAHEVAAEITAAGGSSVADTNDITTEDGAQSLIETAIAAFGRVDAVINNAGIYGTDSFPDIGLATLERFLSVHVAGSFNVTRAAWPHLLSSPHGRVVFTTSHGALGSKDLVAYGTAKAAVIGLTRSLADLAKTTNIRVNAVAPNGITRMALSGIDQGQAGSADMINSPGFAPGLVSPTVALLVHEQCPVNGEIISAGLRRQARIGLFETVGRVEREVTFGPEELLANWADIVDTGAAHTVKDHPDWLAFSGEVLADAATKNPA